jgi:hypothetical protein
VDPRTGVITVAECAEGKAGEPPCLDFETRPVYFLSYKVGFFQTIFKNFIYHQNLRIK